MNSRFRGKDEQRKTASIRLNTRAPTTNRRAILPARATAQIRCIRIRPVPPRVAAMCAAWLWNSVAALRAATLDFTNPNQSGLLALGV